MACNAEDEEESLQDNFFKQKYMGVGGFSRVQRFGNVRWDRRHPAHHSRWTDRGGDNCFQIDQYNYNHRPVPYSEDSVYNANNLQCNANKVRFNEDSKRHASPSYSRWNRSPVMRHNENLNLYEYNQSVEDVDANSTKLTGQGHYYPQWESKGFSSRKIKEMSIAHECDRLTDRERRKWDKIYPSQRLVGDLGFDKCSEIKRRKLDKDPKDQTHFYYSRRSRGSSKPVQKVMENAQHRNDDIKIEKNCKIVTQFEGLAKENVVVKVVLKRTDGKEASNSNSKQEDEKRNATAGILESKPHDPFRVKDESVSVCEKFENNTISVENTKTLTGTPDSIKELSSTDLLDSTPGMQRTMAHSVPKNIEIESCCQIEEQSTVCALKVKDKLQLSREVINFSHTNNMKATEDDRIADLDAITFPEKLSTVSNHIRMDNDSDQKNSNEFQENSEKNKVSIVKLGQSELGERDKIIDQKSFEKDQESCIEFIAAKQVKRRKSDETFNRSKNNSLNKKTFISNVKSKESKTTDTIVDKNQGNLFDSFCYFTLPFISSERRHFDLSKKEREETINEHNDDHRKCEAISFTVARSATIGHSQEKSSCAKMDVNKTDLMYSGEKTKICVENTVDITKMESSSTKTGTDENNENNEQHPKHEKGSESNTTVDRSINDFRALNLDKQSHSKHKKFKVNHKHLKHTLKSKKLKSAKQALMISSKMCKKVYKPSEMEVTKEKRKFQEENNKKINPAKKISPIDISGSDKENVDIKRVDNVQSDGQDNLIEECMQTQQVKKVNLDEENVTLNKEINLSQGCTVFKAVQKKDLKQNRDMKVDNVEIDDEEEDYTIIDLNVAPATTYPMTPGLSKDVAPLQEYEDCGMDTEKASGLSSNSVHNMQTKATEIKAHLLQFIYNPDTSDISDDDIGEKRLYMNIDDSNSSVQNSHNDEDKKELQKDIIKTKFKRQQPNKEERRMRMERLEEAYMQLTIDTTNGKENEKSVSKKRKDKEKHHKTKQKSKSGTSISLDKIPGKRKTKNLKSKTLSADKGKCLRNGDLTKTPDDIKVSLMSFQSLDTSKDEKNDTKLSMVNSPITREAGEMQHRKDEGSLDSTYKDSSSKNLNDFLLHHYINSSEKVVSDMENVDNSEAGVDSSHPGQRPEKAAVSDLKATQNYSDKSTDVTKSITAAERSDALAHQQIWQNGFEFIHDLILMDGRKITTKGHIEPKLMNVKEKNMIRCQVCEKYMTPRSFMYHHDNSNIIKQIDIKRSVSNPPKPDPEDIIIWNSGAGDIWEYFLKEISAVDQFGKDRQTSGMSCEKESHQVTGLCSRSTTNAIMVGEKVYMPYGDDQGLVSSGNAVDNLQISSSYALGFIAVPAATLMISSGSANNYQIMSKQAQEKSRQRSENSHTCKSIKSQQSLKNLEKNQLANKSGFIEHHVSDNNLNFTSRPNASVDIVQDAHNCNLQRQQSSGSEKQVKYGSLVTSSKHEQMQNQLRIKALQANILALLGKSTNESFNSGTSPSDGRGELNNNPSRQLGEDDVAQKQHGDTYGQQDIQSSGQCAVGCDLVESQARNCNQIADDQIKRVAALSYSCNHRSVLSPIETTIYNVPSPVEIGDYNTSSILLDDRSGNQNGEAVSSSLGPSKISNQPLSSFETYSIPSASSLDTRSHLSTCFTHAQNEVASNTTMNNSVIPTTDIAAACRKHFGSQQAETPFNYRNLMYSPPVTNNQLAVFYPSHTVIGNQSVSLKNTLSSLNDKKSKLHLMVNNKLSVSSASKENALSMGFATGYEKLSDKIANSEPQETPAVSKSTSQSSSEEASSGNVNTNKPQSKAGPYKTISALDKLINEIDFQIVKDLEPCLMLAKKLEIKCMHELMSRSRQNQALVAELTSTVQSLQDTNDNGKT
ncbi:hypothetical protein CHS0354_025539 [Potamilus streckersoni]|nr:hypothetical protein CHS0354_025539 [Potamilus streckersoni]